MATNYDIALRSPGGAFDAALTSGPAPTTLTAASTLTGLTSGAATLSNVHAQPNTVAGAVGEWHAQKALLGVSPGVNSPLTTDWQDTSGAGHNGSLQTFAGTEASGYDGSGTLDDPYRLVFDGASDVVICGDLGAAEDKTFTYEAWIRTDNDRAVVDGIVHEYGSDAVCVGQLCTYGGYAYAQLTDSTAASALAGGVTYVADGDTHHLVVTGDGSYLQLYVDGAASGSAVAVPAGSVTLANCYLGVNWYSGYWPGELIAARVYPSALSPAQVTQNYVAGPLWDGAAFAAASTLTGMLSGSASLSAAVAPTTLTAASTLTGLTSGAASLSWTDPPARTLTAASTLTGLTSASASISWTAAPARSMTAASTLTGLTSGSAAFSWTAATPTTLTAASMLTGLTSGSASLSWTPAPACALTAASTLTGLMSGSAAISWTSAPAVLMTAASTLTGLLSGSASLASIEPTTLTASSTLTGPLSGAASLAWTAAPARTMTAASTLTGLTSGSASLSWTAAPARTMTAASTLTGMMAAAAALTWSPAPPASFSGASTLTGLMSADAALSWTAAPARTMAAASTLTGLLSGSAALEWTEAAQPRTLTAASTLTGFVSGSAALSWTEAPAVALTGASTLTGRVGADASISWTPAPAVVLLGDSTLTGVISASADLEWSPPAPTTLTASSTLTGLIGGSADVIIIQPVIITAASTLTGVLTTIAAVSGIVQGRSQYSITAAGRIRGFSPSVHRGLTSAATIGRELVSVGHSREGES